MEADRVEKRRRDLGIEQSITVLREGRRRPDRVGDVVHEYVLA
jgi:hypothetical protein